MWNVTVSSPGLNSLLVTNQYLALLYQFAFFLYVLFVTGLSIAYADGQNKKIKAIHLLFLEKRKSKNTYVAEGIF